MVVIDPFSLGVAAISAGLGFFGKKQASDNQYKQAKRQHKLSMRQAMERTRLQNDQIRAQNEYAKYEYEERKKLAYAQVQRNNQAANDAYNTEQARLNEYFKGVAFTQEDMSIQLMERMGANTANAEGRGRSFELAAAKGTLGNYGRGQARLQESVQSQKRQSNRNMLSISRRVEDANAQAMASVAIAPYMQRELPMPTNYGGPRRSGFNTALQIGNSVLGGIGTYMGLAGANPGTLGFGGGGRSGGSFNMNAANNQTALAFNPNTNFGF